MRRATTFHALPCEMRICVKCMKGMKCYYGHPENHTCHTFHTFHISPWQNVKGDGKPPHRNRGDTMQHVVTGAGQGMKGVPQ